MRKINKSEIRIIREINIFIDKNVKNPKAEKSKISIKR